MENFRVERYQLENRGSSYVCFAILNQNNSLIISSKYLIII